jgi:putative Ca2+/H+ antiporter (TMEM165/GDT1 family)
LHPTGAKVFFGPYSTRTTGRQLWLGSTLGMVLADGLAIRVGQALGKKLPERIIKIGAACIFSSLVFITS